MTMMTTTERSGLRALLMTVLVAILMLGCTATSAPEFALSTTLQGEQSLGPWGDLFGTALAVNGPTVFVGANHANGPPFVNGSARPESGKLYFFEQDSLDEWTQSQPAKIGASTFNHLAGAVVSSDGRWLFAPQTGTPIDVDVSKAEDKDLAGGISVYQRHAGEWVFHHFVPNPDGNGPDQTHAEFGLHLAFTPKGGGWLVTGGGITNRAHFLSFDEQQQRFVVRQSVTTSSWKFNMIVAIDDRWAFVQIPLDLSDYYNIPNQVVMVFHRVGQTWHNTQNLTGFDNDGALKSAFGDLFGSPMAIFNKNAIIGAPGDAQANPGGFNLPGAIYFLRLQQNDTWQIVQKSFSDEPTIFFGMGNCLMGDVAIVADLGRTVGGNLLQGALRVYVRNQDGGWDAGELLTDPGGRAYDFLATCALTKDYLVAGSFRAAATFLGDPSLVGPPLPGRVVIFDRLN